MGRDQSTMGCKQCAKNPSVHWRSAGRSSNGSVSAWLKPAPVETRAAAGLCSKWIPWRITGSSIVIGQSTTAVLDEQ